MSTTNRAIFVAMLLLTQLSCTSLSSAKALSQPLSQRTLRISESLDRFEYCGRVCDKFALGICFGKWEQKCDYYPFSDKIIIKQLLDGEMVLKQRQKP